MNLIDTAINYRFQRSERSIGSALRRLVSRGFGREELVVCTKAGFLTPDGEMPDDINEYFAEEFLSSGIFAPEDIAADCHCMKPSYLADQIERSRRNLGVECIDVFYLHNPETQLAEVSPEKFRARIRDAFAFLNRLSRKARDRPDYGLAIWTAFREKSGSKSLLSIEVYDQHRARSRRRRSPLPLRAASGSIWQCPMRSRTRTRWLQAKRWGWYRRRARWD